MAAPRASFPRMMRDDSEFEAAYRLFRNPDVSPDAVLSAHYMASAERVQACAAPVIVVHDTTECSFGGEAGREGVGSISHTGNGLAIHVALAIAQDGTPHGLLDVVTHTRLAPSSRRSRSPAAKESARWGKTVERAASRLGPAAPRAVHVMDREGDSYVLLEALDRAGRAFVVRSGHNRRIRDDNHELLRESVEGLSIRVERDVPLSRRSDYYRHLSTKRQHPARNARVARLAVSSRTVTVECRPDTWKYVRRRELCLTAVRVWEPDPPTGEPPVEWLLLTNLPARSVSEIEAIVDVYRARWTVEEFFKALKTGCAFERRQLESRHALENALAILAPIACQLLLLRSLARSSPSRPATDVLTPTQLTVLRAISARFKVPANPSVRDALYAVAGLGGFLRRNGEPGWQTIGLGFESLLEAEQVWNTATRQARCDQC